MGCEHGGVVKTCKSTKQRDLIQWNQSKDLQCRETHFISFIKLVASLIAILLDTSSKFHLCNLFPTELIISMLLNFCFLIYYFFLRLVPQQKKMANKSIIVKEWKIYRTGTSNCLHIQHELKLLCCNILWLLNKYSLRCAYFVFVVDF